jgi:hypothetical protein
MNIYDPIGYNPPTKDEVSKSIFIQIGNAQVFVTITRDDKAAPPQLRLEAMVPPHWGRRPTEPRRMPGSPYQIFTQALRRIGYPICPLHESQMSQLLPGAPLFVPLNPQFVYDEDWAWFYDWKENHSSPNDPWVGKLNFNPRYHYQYLSSSVASLNSLQATRRIERAPGTHTLQAPFRFGLVESSSSGVDDRLPKAVSMQ